MTLATLHLDIKENNPFVLGSRRMPTHSFLAYPVNTLTHNM